MINQTFSFRTAYLPFSFDVAECVISRDEQEYYGDTARHWFLLKWWGPSNNCASWPPKASSGTDRIFEKQNVLEKFSSDLATLVGFKFFG